LLGARRPHHRGLKRIGDALLNLSGGEPWRFHDNDDLIVGKIRKRFDRNALIGKIASRQKSDKAEEHEQSLA